MARTRLFGALRRALNSSGAAFGPRALSRRNFLVLGAAAAAASACSRAGGRVGIVGGGAAGLVVAYKLAQAHKPATLYEASDRLGGRMFTRPNFNSGGQFCELGGELVDTNHTALRVLALELGVPVVRLAPESDPGLDVYRIGGRTYGQNDMMNAAGAGAFARLAERIAVDQAALLDEEENWTDRAHELDAMSVRDYLSGLASFAPAWAIGLLDLAYQGEYGIATTEQSALNLVDFIGVESSGGFLMFGDSDEAMRIEGGSSRLTDALAERLGGVRREMRHALVAVARNERGVTLTFEGPAGRVEREHDTVVFALPFTKLRTVEGLDGLGLGEAKVRAIRELGYGDNAKLMVSTRDRAWLGATQIGRAHV